MVETQEFSITRASQLTIPNKDWTHYRMGLKLKCTTTYSSSVSLEIISQGRCIDVTHLNSSNVKFLVKEPVVGLKIFDGDTLNKRLQITFASEAHFNFFSNKIQQWIGISLQSESYSYPDSQKSESNAERQSTSTGLQNNVTTTMKSSQISSQEMSQNFTQDTFSQRNPISSSQIFLTQEEPIKRCEKPPPQAADWEVRSYPTGTEPQVTKSNESSLQEGFQTLLNAARLHETNDYDSTILSQSTDLFSNNTQYNTYSTSGTLLPDTECTANTSVYTKPQLTRADLTATLKGLPFDTSQKKRSKSSRKKNHSMDRILEKTLTHILKEKKKSLLTMTDEELSVNVARRLHSQSFLKLLKRVEHIISD